MLTIDTMLERTEREDVRVESTPEETVEFSSFGLPKFLQQGLSILGFEHPTTIQAQSIPTLMAGNDLVAQSQTGSGKTAAFAIPLISRVQRQSRDLQALVMVPTRELAIQVTQVFKSLAGPSVRITPIYGGAGMEGQVRGLRQGGFQIVIGTPGRLRDHLNRGTLRLDRLRMVVLDEADEMLDRGFAPDVEAILQAAPVAAKRQTALFSATLPDWVTQTAAKHLRPDHVSVTLTSTPDSRPDIEQLVYDMATADKIFALRHLLDTFDKQPILVFVRTKYGVKKLATKLQEEGYSVAGLQGNLSQRAREEVMAAFRSNKVRIMVATNVGARGLDVSGISHVINFDLPESAELFTHRVGRTGRNGASGTAITFLTREDRGKWREIEQVLRGAGIEVKRDYWNGPKAEPGAAPAFVQPLPRTFGQSRSGSQFGNSSREPRRDYPPRSSSEWNAPRAEKVVKFPGNRSGNDEGQARNSRGRKPSGNRFERPEPNGNDWRFEENSDRPRRRQPYR